MTVGLLGKKVGMTQVFDKEGLAVPVTVVKLGDNIVTECMTKERNGYTAVQVGGFKTQEKKLTKPEAGHFKKRELPMLDQIREFRVDDTSAFKIGEPIAAETVLKEGMLVDVRGKSIGKGFQGTIKRYNAGRGNMTHGSKFHRSMGSIGQHTDPGRVFKGIHMPGQMGNKNACVRHLKVVQIDKERGVVLICGAVPGAKGQVVMIQPSKTKWNP